MTVWRIYKRNICLLLLAISAKCLFTEFFVFSVSSGAYLLVRQQSIGINMQMLVSFESELNSPGNIHVGKERCFYGHAFMLEKSGKNIFFLKILPFIKHSDIGKTFQHLQWWWDLNHFRQALANIKGRDIPLSDTCT